MNSLLKPSVQSFLSRDKLSPMYAKPWRKFLAEQDRRFRAQYRDDHPSFACRWTLHQLRQAHHIETMFHVHAGLTPDELNQLWLKHKLEYETVAAEAWRSVVWPAKEERRAA